MADEALIAATNWLDEAGADALTGAAAAGNPLANLLTASPGEVWRSTGSSPVQIGGSFGASRQVSFCALQQWRGGTLLGAADTLRLRLYDTATSPASVVYDSGTVTAGIDYRGTWAVQFAAVEAEEWTLDIAFAAASVDVGRIWLCDPVVPVRSIAFDSPDEWLDTGDNAVARVGGRRFPRAGVRQRRVTFGWDTLTAAEAELLRRVAYDAGVTGQVLVCTSPAIAPKTTTVLGAFRRIPAFSRPPLTDGIWQTSAAEVVEDV